MEVVVEDWLPAASEFLSGSPNGFAGSPEDGVGDAWVGLQDVAGVADPGGRGSWLVYV